MGIHKVVHLGCAHGSEDSRIRYKECETLAGAGYDVTYITSYQSISEADHDGTAPCTPNLIVCGGGYDRRGVLITRHVLEFIRYRMRNKRIIIECIMNENPDVVHIHELELMYVVKGIRKKNPDVKIVFDVHEDYPADYYDIFLEKSNRILANIVQSYVKHKTANYIKCAEKVITVTPTILKKIKNINNNCYLVRNFPIIRQYERTDEMDRKKQVCYCGSMAECRGIEELVGCVDRIDAKFVLAGGITEKLYNKLASKYDAWNNEKIDYLGIITQSEVWKVYRQSSVGICCYKLNKNNYDAYPTKLFEYMMSGLPIVCSDFPAWREIVEANGCGLLVNPDNVDDISEAIGYLLDNEDEAITMGKNGRRAVEEKYNWDAEGKKLLEIYSRLGEA